MSKIRHYSRALLLGFALLLVTAVVSTARAAYDDWSVHDERIVAVNAVTVTSTAQLVPAITGKRIAFVGGVIGCDTAGVVQLQDGSGGTTIGCILFPAGGSYTISRDQLGLGVKTTSGNALYAVGPSGGKVSGTFRIQAVSQ